MSATLDVVDRIDALRTRAAVLVLALEALGESDVHDRLADFAGQIVNDLYAISEQLSAIARENAASRFNKKELSDGHPSH